MKQEKRISRRALVRRFITTCTVVGVISLIIGIIIGMIIGNRTSITAEAAVYRVSDGPGADIHITLNETEPETIENIEEAVVTVIETEPETSAAQTQQTEPETSETQQKLVQLSTSDEQMLLKLAMAEAESQGVTGKALVMDVVLNRVQSASFPNSVEGVIFEKGQFSPVSNGRYYKVSPDAECYQALELVENGWNESQGATYFCAGMSSWHENHLTRLFKSGSHTFYK